MECIITIELGTNAVRVFAFDLGGNVIGSLKAYCPTFHTEPERSEQDPEQIFITMLYVLKSLLNDKIHPKKYRVTSICFSSSMHSLLVVDKNGTPLGNAITWGDNRANKEAQELKNLPLGGIIYDATGTPLHPMSPLTKICWLRNNDQDRFLQAAKFLSIKTYIIQQLTGACLIDYSLASATGLLNIHKIGWEPEALKYAGINADMLPELTPVFASAGRLKKAYQHSLGFSANTRIIVGSSDGCMAILGDGINGEGSASITIEDSGAVRVMGSKVIQDERQRFFNYLLTENCYVSGGPTNNGGVVFEWFARQFGEFKNPFDTDQCIQDLIKVASKVPAGSEGLIFLPYLLGERAPIWNANARGAYFGINIKHEKNHFVRATIEGILYEVYSIGKILAEHAPVKSLSINGSFGTMPFCSQLIADLFDKPVRLRSDFHSVSVGTYLVAATEMGLFPSLDDAAGKVVLREQYQPNKENHLVYAALFEVFAKLTALLKDEFDNIAALQHQANGALPR